MFSKALLINISETALDKEYFEKISELCSKVVSLPKDDPNISKELTDTDCLLTGFGVVVDKGMINTAPNLKYIGVLATAFDKVDIKYAKQKNIPVCNLGGYSTESVAEFVIGATLENIRALEEGKQRGRNANYSEDNMKVRELKGSEFGIIGLGNIGTRVAEIATGFGAKVSYWSRAKKSAAFTYKELDQLIKDSDYISINLAAAPQINKIINADRLNSLKNGAVVINTCPMDLIDIDALSKRLAKGDITFILDHSDEMTAEELAKLSPYKNCIIYPPIAYISLEARRNKQETFVNNMAAALEGNPQNQVN